MKIGDRRGRQVEKYKRDESNSKAGQEDSR